MRTIWKYGLCFLAWVFTYSGTLFAQVLVFATDDWAPYFSPKVLNQGVG
ncbi:MAG: hypothetical protein ACKOAD_06900 [Gammaproteobacteria bacterium]